ncbi:hypothetical protein [Microcoleus sp. PH2017_36_ELK_O_B]|uniref:hypothetical protein n=1 Tax=Microcoleus sp. PH2017_36_ELK_O_B TaxID=2798846 RepID=UPI0025E7F374|nr:hypothetical protein [Microcoleus sp. PH2017_36_ELK_O_B]
MGWASRPSRKDGRDAHPTFFVDKQSAGFVCVGAISILRLIYSIALTSNHSHSIVPGGLEVIS